LSDRVKFVITHTGRAQLDCRYFVERELKIESFEINVTNRVDKTGRSGGNR
jgi:hypothetical protein